MIFADLRRWCVAMALMLWCIWALHWENRRRARGGGNTLESAARGALIDERMARARRALARIGRGDP